MLHGRAGKEFRVPIPASAHSFPAQPCFSFVPPSKATAPDTSPHPPPAAPDPPAPKDYMAPVSWVLNCYCSKHEEVLYSLLVFLNTCLTSAKHLSLTLFSHPLCVPCCQPGPCQNPVVDGCAGGRQGRGQDMQRAGEKYKFCRFPNHITE